MSIQATDRMFGAVAVDNAKRQVAMMGRELVRTDITTEQVRIYGAAFQSTVTGLREVRRHWAQRF